ncbi:hypothetical protein [Eupransor demetentiae]|uniref:Contains N-terminal Zn ribbon domain (YvbJ) n=1 Tax=Eupransor demetentiae TaxID=3109584 RepID=A0ABP0ETU4_9LACO|nr:Uncharacterized protein YvbJ [Lactobacillaceae bacterium LMG 33000]
MKQQEWLSNFKKEYGRNPNLDEFEAAQKQGFPVEKVTDSEGDLKAWVQAFEQEKGRQPSFAEVQQRKAAEEVAPLSQPKQMKAWVLAFEQQYGYTPSLDEVLAYKDFLEHPEKYAALQEQSDQDGLRRKRIVNIIKIAVLSIVGLLLLAMALLAYGKHYYSYQTTLARDANILKSYDSARYAKISKWSKSDKPISADDLEAMAAYMKGEKMSSAEIQQWIERPDKGVSLKKDGKAWFMFQRYSLKYEPTNIEVSTNQSGLSILANNRTVTSHSSSDGYMTIKNKVPGLYNLVAEGKVDGKKVRATNSNYFGGPTNGVISLNVDKNSKDEDLSDDDAMDLMSNMANSLNEYSISDGNFKDADGVFKGGAGNKSYKSFTDLISHNLHHAKRNADAVNFNLVNVTDVDKKSKQTATVKFEMAEEFDYSCDTDPKNGTAGTKIQRYLMTAHLVYDKDKKQWLIDSVDSKQKKLSEDDNVN